jgi:hypothetical protein
MRCGVKQLLCVLVMLVALGGDAIAQATAYTVAVFPNAATNPATATHIAAPVTYPIAQIVCDQTKVAEVTPIVNPVEGRIDDPANPTTHDCAVPIESQFRALPVGSAYKAAFRTVAGTQVSAWSAFTTAFAVTAQTHPCDAPTLSTATVLEGTRTLTFCHDGRDVNGSLVPITGWAVYIDGVRSVLANVTAGATTNSAGLRNCSVSLALTRGTRHQCLCEWHDGH